MSIATKTARSTWPRRFIGVFFCLSSLYAAGPVDFGMAELNSALASRKLKTKMTVDLSTDPPETYRIEPYRAGGAHISGGDLRGLMYGLLDAAEQIRATGRLKQSHGVPARTLRSIRVVLHSADFESSWYYSEDFWRAYFQMMARNRFNRINLVFADRSPDLMRRYGMLRFISQTATDHGIDFALGLPDPALLPSPEVLDNGGAGNPSGDSLATLLVACPMVRSVQILGDAEPSSSGGHPFEFYRDNVLQPLHEAGRRVALDLRSGPGQSELIKAAEDLGLALRLALTYSEEDVDRLDQNPQVPRPHDFYWELSSGSPASWRDAESVARANRTLERLGPAGFELDAPPLGSTLERDGTFSALWGRSGYDLPKLPVSIPAISSLPAH